MGATRSWWSAPLIKEQRQQEHWRATRTPLKGIAFLLVGRDLESLQCLYQELRLQYQSTPKFLPRDVEPT